MNSPPKQKRAPGESARSRSNDQDTAKYPGNVFASSPRDRLHARAKSGVVLRDISNNFVGRTGNPKNSKINRKD